MQTHKLFEARARTSTNATSLSKLNDDDDDDDDDTRVCTGLVSSGVLGPHSEEKWGPNGLKWGPIT